MVCVITCSVAIMFLVATIYLNISSAEKETLCKYRDQLTPELKKIHKKIVKERMDIANQGYFLGFAISLIVILMNYYQHKDKKMSTVSIVCIVLGVTFTVQYFYYMIHPKTDWMLNHIKDPKQAKAWLNMYKEMQRDYHIGLLLGLVAVGVTAMAFRCKKELKEGSDKEKSINDLTEKEGKTEKISINDLTEKEGKTEKISINDLKENEVGLEL